MTKICLIIGGTGGLGRVCAEHVASKGYTAIVSGRNKQKGEEVVQAIKFNGGEASFLPCDIKSESDLRRLHRTIIERHGRLDAAINSAGISPNPAPITRMNMEDFHDTIQTNLTAVFISMQEQIRAMLQNPDGPGGHIINLTSKYGLAGCPWGSHYSASKHAIIGLTRSAALEVANQNIYINAIAPGVTPTGMVDALGETADKDEGFRKILEGLLGTYPTGRFGTPDQVAKAVLYLLECDWVTGTVLEVDGGWAAGKAVPVGVRCEA